MANTYTWFIDSLDVIPFIENQTNIVSCIHYRLSASDGLKPTPHTAMIWGTQMLPYSAENSFTNYDDLTEEIVIGWLKTELGQAQINILQTNLNEQIANIVNPPISNLPVPW